MAEALAAAAGALERAGVPDSRFEARYLLGELLGVSPGSLIARGETGLELGQAEAYRSWVSRRCAREPAQHITGRQEFFGRTFRCDARALVPRPETELVVRAALSIEGAGQARVLDVGTGSGCIAISLALERPRLQVTALEKSAEALSLARENARLHGVEERIRWIQGDLASPWKGPSESYDLVVANPPYVSEAEWHDLEPEVRDHDPREALVAGPTGLEAYAALTPAATDWLSPGGRLIVELGFGQERAVRDIVRNAGLVVSSVERDLRGIPRVMVALRSGAEHAGSASTPPSAGR